MMSIPIGLLNQIMEGKYPESVFQHYIDAMPTIEDDDMSIISEEN